jgi:hypothetical protein
VAKAATKSTKGALAKVVGQLLVAVEGIPTGAPAMAFEEAKETLATALGAAAGAPVTVYFASAVDGPHDAVHGVAVAEPVGDCAQLLPSPVGLYCTASGLQLIAVGAEGEKKNKAKAAAMGRPVAYFGYGQIKSCSTVQVRGSITLGMEVAGIGRFSLQAKGLGRSLQKLVLALRFALDPEARNAAGGGMASANPLAKARAAVAVGGGGEGQMYFNPLRGSTAAPGGAPGVGGADCFEVTLEQGGNLGLELEKNKAGGELHGSAAIVKVRRVRSWSRESDLTCAMVYCRLRTMVHVR